MNGVESASNPRPMSITPDRSHRDRETIRARHLPEFAPCGIACAGDEFARLQRGIEFGEAEHLALGDAAREMLGTEVLGCSSPAAAVSSASACSIERWKLRTRSVLSSTTSARARVGSCVATPVGQRSVWQLSDWMQPSANMKPRAELHQSAPSAKARGHVEGGDDLAGAADPDPVAQPDADERVAHEDEAFAQRHAEMIGEFERRGAGAALLAVDHDEVGLDAALHHRLAEPEEFPGMADAELEADRLAAARARAVWR